MINLSAHSVVFNVKGRELSRCIREALKLAAEKHLDFAGLQHVCLESVTTKTNVRAAFAKFVKGRVLLQPSSKFDRIYVEKALNAYAIKSGYLSREIFNFLFSADEGGAYGYMRTYGPVTKAPLGLFLVALHSSGAVTLPSTFTWPILHDRNGNKLEVGKFVASELLSFVRSLDPKSEKSNDRAFDVIGGDRVRRSWFLSYATRLLLATGWHRPEEVNIQDLIKIKAADKEINGGRNIPFAYSALLDVLAFAFEGRTKVTSRDWVSAIRLAVATNVSRTGSAARDWQKFNENGPRRDCDLLDEVLNLTSAVGKPARLRSLSRLPGLEVDFVSISKLWLDLEDLYVTKVPRENYKPVYNALGWWNLYIFYYLPYWFERNPTSPCVFPHSPSLLLKSVFVSRLLPMGGEVPATFTEFLSLVAMRRKWLGTSHYSVLLQIERFFGFVERCSDEIAGCEGFEQPLGEYDHPSSTRAKHSKKVPVPRRFFGMYLDYYEALIAYHSVVTNAVLAGDVLARDLERLTVNGTIIDTFATSQIVGFIPIVVFAASVHPLQFIPNILDLHRKTLRDGRNLLLPHPHALHQNIVALHTGLRHNHIQWLDRDRFDELVDEGGGDFASLFVNTDKQRTKPWTPYVSFRVIEILRAQRRWCEQIGDPLYEREHFYNNNPSTKWPKFKPLFSYTKKGRPHSDELYADVWKSVLCGLQGLIVQAVGSGKGSSLVKLLPPTVAPDDVNLKSKLESYGATFTEMGDYCPLRVHTTSTPHSSRVAVVSQYITFLPADLIGKYITGQKPGTVSYYVHLDQAELEAKQIYQAAQLREAVLKGALEPIMGNANSATSFIHADRTNSNLARSMRANLEGTITAHGGMCITFGEIAKHGMDLLREKRGVDVAFNKTEICIFGNNCPPDVIKDLNGLRRCSLCPYAVRFVDHLPAVMAKKRQLADALDDLERVINVDTTTLNSKYTVEELDLLEAERVRICEDLSGWILSEEMLEVMRQRIASGQDNRTWAVQRPKIIEENLRRVTVQTTETEYVLARLGECIAYPTLESPQIRARVDLMRRELLARSGNIREAFSSVASDPASECAGMLKAIVESRGLTLSQIAAQLSGMSHLEALPKVEPRLILNSDFTENEPNE